MGFSAKQVQLLRRDVNPRHIRSRIGNGRELSYIEGAHAISEANRIFGFDGWDRETVESRCVITRETRGSFLAVYTAKVRITVRTDQKTIIREGYGSGEARGDSPGETHALALKGAETDATKRALATFGKPFGLALYAGNKRRQNLNPNQVNGAGDANEQSHKHKRKTRNIEAIGGAALNGKQLNVETKNETNTLSSLCIENSTKEVTSEIKGNIDKSVLKFGAPPDIVIRPI